MASFKDLFGVTEKEAAKEAASNVTEAFGGVGDAAKELGVLFVKDVGKPLQILKTQLEKNAEALVRSQKRGTISDGAARAASKANAAAMERVAKTSKELAEQNVTGAAAAMAMNKEIEKATKLAAQENKLLKAGLRAKTALQKAEVAVMRAQQTARRAMEAARFELKADRINSGESKIVKGGAGALHGLASKLPGSSGVGPSGFGGGAIEALGSAGAWGMAAAAVGKTLAAVMNTDRDAAIAATQKFLNYGSGTQVELAGNVSEVKQAFTEAYTAARMFNGDVEAISSSMTKIWTQTGEEVPKVAASFAVIEKLRLAGIGSTEELTDLIIKRMNQTGMSMADATQEMQDISLMAKTLQKDAGGHLVIQMDDFYKGVQELSEGMESLSVNQKGLSKTFAANLKLAKNLTASYDRNKAAALGLTKALTSNYDTGFATVNVREELNAAMQSSDKDVVANAQKILKALENGEYLEDTAAKFAKELGVTSDASVTQFRLEFAKQTGGGLNMLESQFGPLTADMYDLVKNVMAKVGPGQKLEDILPQLDKNTRKEFEEAMGRAAKAQEDPAKVLAEIQAKTLNAVSSVVPSLLTTINTTLLGISSIITGIYDAIPDSWKTLTPADKAAAVAQDKLESNKDDAINAFSKIRDTMSSRYFHGDKTKAAEAVNFRVGSKGNPANQDLFNQLRGDSPEAKAARAEMMHATGGAGGGAESMKKALIKGFGGAGGNAVNIKEAITVYKQAREEFAASKAAGTLHLDATGPAAADAAGGIQQKFVATVSNPSAAKDNRKLAGMNKRTADAGNPVGGGTAH